MFEEVAKEALERCVTIVKNEEEEEEATFDYSYIHWSKEENRSDSVLVSVCSSDC